MLILTKTNDNPHNHKSIVYNPNPNPTCTQTGIPTNQFLTWTKIGRKPMKEETQDKLGQLVMHKLLVIQYTKSNIYNL